jgi:hypothetical protein
MSHHLIHIPVDGEITLYLYDVDAEQLIPGGRLVNVHLNRDGAEIGRLVFDTDAAETNPRATSATGWLSGSYVKVVGPAVFDEITLDQAIGIMEECA